MSEFKYRLHSACDVAKRHLKGAQAKMKAHYDRQAKSRVFEVGEKVLVLLTILGDPLKARFSGPYVV